MRTLFALFAWLFTLPAFAEDRGFGFTFDITTTTFVCVEDVCKKDGVTPPPARFVHAIIVEKLACGGPAIKAGVLSGDVLLEINGTSIVGMELSKLIELLDRSLTDTQILLRVGRKAAGDSEPTMHTLTLVPGPHNDNFSCGVWEEM